MFAIVGGISFYGYSNNEYSVKNSSQRSSSSSSNNQYRFRREYCAKTESGETICIKRENIICKQIEHGNPQYVNASIYCQSSGIKTDLVGNRYHWSEKYWTPYSTVIKITCAKIDRGRESNRIALLKGVHWDRFTCQAAKYTGVLDKFRP